MSTRARHWRREVNGRCSLATTTSHLTSWQTVRRRPIRSAASSVLRRRRVTIAVRRQRDGTVAWRRCSVRRWSPTSWRWCVPLLRQSSLSCWPSASTGCTTVYESSNCIVLHDQVSGPRMLAAVLLIRYISTLNTSITVQIVLTGENTGQNTGQNF